VTNVTFSFDTSPNTNPTRKSGGNMAYYIPPSKTMGGYVPRVPHQIAPMIVHTYTRVHALLRCTNVIDKVHNFDVCQIFHFYQAAFASRPDVQLSLWMLIAF